MVGWKITTTEQNSVSAVTIRLRAKTLAEEMKIKHFQGPSRCFRFMTRRQPSIRTWTTLAQRAR